LHSAIYECTEGIAPTCSASTRQLGDYCNISAGTANGNIVNYDSVVVASPTDVCRQQLRQYFVFMRATRNVISRISLLPTAYKLFANIIKIRLNEYLEDEMVEEQCGFRKGRSCTDAIFTVQQIMEKRKEHNLPLFLLFIDYAKAYDNVNRDKL